MNFISHLLRNKQKFEIPFFQKLILPPLSQRRRKCDFKTWGIEEKKGEKKKKHTSRDNFARKNPDLGWKWYPWMIRAENVTFWLYSRKPNIIDGIMRSNNSSPPSSRFSPPLKKSLTFLGSSKKKLDSTLEAGCLFGVHRSTQITNPSKAGS